MTISWSFSFNSFVKFHGKKIGGGGGGGGQHDCLFCLFDLILYVPSTIFQLNRDRSSWVKPVLS